MSDPRPRPARGRGRGKLSYRVTESGVRAATSDVIRQDNTREGQDGRWQDDRWTDHGTRFDGGEGTSSKFYPINDGGHWKHDRWTDSDVTTEENHGKKPASPSGKIKRSDVIGGSSKDGGNSEETYGDQRTSVTARPARNRPKRPEVQRYVPRGRRLQEEAEKKSSQSSEDNSVQHNEERASKNHNATKLDTECKKLKDDFTQTNSGKRVVRTKEEKSSQICPQDTKSTGNNADQHKKEKRADRTREKNSSQVHSGRRNMKSREDNSSLKFEENLLEMSDGKQKGDSEELRSKSSSHGTDRKRQTRNNVYIPPGRRKDTSERMDIYGKEAVIERADSSEKEFIIEGVDNSDKEVDVQGEDNSGKVVETIREDHPVVLVDRHKSDKMDKWIDKAKIDITEFPCDEVECSDRQQDAVECSKGQGHHGATDKSVDPMVYHDKLKIDKDEEQISSESEEYVPCDSYFINDEAVNKYSEGYTDTHVEVVNQSLCQRKPEDMKCQSREYKIEDVSMEDSEEDLGSLNKKIKVECSTIPPFIEHSKADDVLCDAADNASWDKASAILKDHEISMISDEKERTNLDICLSRNEDSQKKSNIGDIKDDIKIDILDKICDENLTDKDTIETNETMETDDTKKMIGFDDQISANENLGDCDDVQEKNKEEEEMDEKQTNVDDKSNDNEDEDEEEDSWDKMFDDEGECLDPSAVEELTKKVGKVKIQRAKINYLDFKPKDPDLNYDEMGHVIEIFGFPAEFKTEDLLSIFQPYKDKGFDIKWVDDTHALGVFSSPIAAQSALSLVHPLCKVGPLTDAARASKVKAKRAVEFLQPYKPRPETSAAAARRLVSGALGLSTRVTKEQREKERQKLREAKEKRKMEKKQKDDIWEGTCTSSHGHDDR